MSTLPPSPFLSASDGLHPQPSVAVAPLAPPALGAAAEISSAEPLSAGPAVVAGLNPGSVTTAGTIPLDYETILKALESCLHEDWIFGIDEPDPLLFIRDGEHLRRWA